MDKVASKEQLPRPVGVLRVLVGGTKRPGSLGRVADWNRENPFELTCLVFRQLLLGTGKIATRACNGIVFVKG